MEYTNTKAQYWEKGMGDPYPDEWFAPQIHRVNLVDLGFKLDIQWTEHNGTRYRGIVGARELLDFLKAEAGEVRS